jgi:HupE / UreJ protein
VAPAAHDIPNDVTIQSFLKPDGQRLRFLVRVPLNAMRDMDYPKVRGATNSDLLDLSRANSTLRDAATLWLSDYLDLFENGQPLPAPTVIAVRASLQSDKSFASYDEALANTTGPPLPRETQYFWSEGLLDVVFEYPIHSDRSQFSISPRLARLGIRTLTELRFLPAGGGVESFEFLGDPGLVYLDPNRFQVVRQFAGLGVRHLLDASDSLLFLVCLVMPFRRLRPLAAVVIAFAAASSIAIIASAYNLAPDALWFPPLVETLIAASVVYMAVENVIAPRLERRWVMTFAVGLTLGAGLAFALRRALQFAGTHVLTSVLSYNAGVELAVVAVVAVMIPALVLVFRYLVAERTGTIILSALAAHTAWHWMLDRFDLLRKFRFEWPPIDAAFLAGAMRWMMLAVVATALYWLVFDVFRANSSASRSSTP